MLKIIMTLNKKSMLTIIKEDMLMLSSLTKMCIG